MSQVPGATSSTRRRSRVARACRHLAWGTVMTVVAATVGTATGTTAAFAAPTQESTVTIVSSQNPSVAGQGVTFTATVTGTPGTPTGSVQFAIDGLPVGSAVALSGGVATSPAFSEADGLTSGIHQVDANYSGDTGFLPATELLFQDVGSNTTTVGVTSTPNPSLVGQAVTFDVTVSATSGGTPVGVVYLLVDGAQIDSVSSTTGHETFVESGILAGVHTVDALFSPDTPDFVDGQGSLTGGQTVSAGLATVVNSSTPNPSQLGDSVTLTATVAPVAPATAIPTGTVEFFEGTTSLGIGTVDGSGQATAAISTLPVGVHSITSVYTSADPALYPNATSAAYSHTVTKGATAVAVSVLPADPVHGELATLTAAVTSLGGQPTGTVEFFDGATSLGSATLSAGSASISTSTLATGTRSLTAVYAGDDNFLPGTSPVNATVVGQASTSTVMEAPTSDSVFGAPVNFSAQVSAVAPGAGTPTGTVQFFVDGVATGNPVAVDGSGVAVSGGIATMTAGTHSITAAYVEDTDFATSTSDAVQQTVSPATSTFTITVNGSTSATIGFGQNATLSAVGLPVGAQGTVTFSSPNDADLCTITLPATSCQTSAALPVGSHSPIGAAFIDTDGNYTGSASANTATLTVSALKPGKATGVHATLLSGRRVKVTWTAPANNSGSPITGYTVTATPGGKTVSVSGSATQATIIGLAAGKYTFTVSATNGAGTGAKSAASNAVQIAGTRAGYWMLGKKGHVYGFGAAAHLGDAPGESVAMANRKDGRGYWVVNAAGNVSHFGTAKGFGGKPALRAGEVVSTLSATPSGNGYWLFTNRGRVFAYGDAHFYGDMSAATLNGPVVASVATPTGHGYYMVGSDGGVFTFGDAKFHGSTGAMHLNKPIVGMSPTPDNKGYWLVASDGGVFAFKAPFRGSMGHVKLNQAVNGLVAFGNGYLMVASDGGVFNFSNKPFFGSLAANPPNAPIIGISAFTE